MPFKAKLLLYSLDFSGLVPQFRILNYDSYKSIFSTIISFMVILFSLCFAINFTINYFLFKNPSISYLKRFDNASNRTINLKDTLFMFRVFGNCDCDNYSDLEFEYFPSYVNGEIAQPLKIEKCEIGKNINSKFKETVEKIYNKTKNEYYCISSEYSNLSLYYDPGVIETKESFIEIEIYDYNTICHNSNFSFSLITENDIINHYNKEDPIDISTYFFTSPNFSSAISLTLDYNFEYIRYEIDNGYFFEESKDKTAIGLAEIFHDIDYRNNNHQVGRIFFGQSERYYSHYKRSYKKIQTLFAEIMSIIKILFETGKILSYFLLQKKMSKDIIRSLINDDYYTRNKDHSVVERNLKEKNVIKDLMGKKSNSERNNKKKEILDKTKIKDKSNQLYKIKLDLKKHEEHEKKTKKMKTNILKNITFFDVIKSYFCFKLKKTKLVNMCHNLVMKDLCLDRMLGRLYELEKIYYLFSKEERHKLYSKTNKKLEELSQCIYAIYKENKNKNKNNQITNTINTEKKLFE